MKAQLKNFYQIFLHLIFSDAMFTIVSFTLGITIMFMIYIGIASNINYDSKCKSNNGTPVYTSNNKRFCVNSNFFIKVE